MNENINHFYYNIKCYFIETFIIILYYYKNVRIYLFYLGSIYIFTYLVYSIKFIILREKISFINLSVYKILI